MTVRRRAVDSCSSLPPIFLSFSPFLSRHVRNIFCKQRAARDLSVNTVNEAPRKERGGAYEGVKNDEHRDSRNAEEEKRDAAVGKTDRYEVTPATGRIVIVMTIA